jgi:hypothetical protein
VLGRGPKYSLMRRIFDCRIIDLDMTCFGCTPDKLAHITCNLDMESFSAAQNKTYRSRPTRTVKFFKC